MPTRRRILRGSVATAGIALSVGTAGCLDDDAEDDYEEAVDLIEESGDLIDEAAEGDDLEEAFDPDGIHRRLDEAEDLLDDAESDADGDLADLIENARAVAQYNREAVTLLEEVEALLHCFDATTALIEAERWEDAEDEIAECRDISGRVEDSFAALESAHAEIDEELLEEEGAFELDEIEDSIDELEGYVNAIDGLVDGMEDLLAGMTLFADASDSFDAEQYTTAATEFEAARDEFNLAEDVFATLEDDPDLPPDVRPDVIEIRCYGGALADGAGYMADAADAADRGDWSAAEAYSDDAIEAFDRCD